MVFEENQFFIVENASQNIVYWSSISFFLSLVKDLL